MKESHVMVALASANGILTPIAILSCVVHPNASSFVALICNVVSLIVCGVAARQYRKTENEVSEVTYFPPLESEEERDYDRYDAAYDAADEEYHFLKDEDEDEHELDLEALIEDEDE